MVIVAVLLIGPPFTIWWWKQADKWADAEHKRFKPKVDDTPRIVVKFDTPGAQPSASERSEGAESGQPESSGTAER